MYKTFAIIAILLGAIPVGANPIQDAVHDALDGLNIVASDDPYSNTIQRMYIGYNAEGQPVTGVAYREIKSFKTITGLVIVDHTDEGFVLREAVFPDISKIKSAKDRKQVLTVLRAFKGVSFDPHAEQSAVDGVSGATRHGLKTTGYLNYLSRRTALAMEDPPEWAKPK